MLEMDWMSMRRGGNGRVDGRVLGEREGFQNEKGQN
jgi:hypothetical protein